MQLQLKSLAGVLAIATSSGVAAQAQQPAQQTTSTTTQQSPDQTQTTTTNSTTTAVPGTPATPAQTQTTTTQSTTTTPTDATGKPTGPSEGSTTTESATAAQAATAADVKAGVSVFDQNGGLVGKVESVSSKGAVVSTGKVKASIPISSFAKNDKGLVIAMTKAEIDAQAKKSATKPK